MCFSTHEWLMPVEMLWLKDIPLILPLHNGRTDQTLWASHMPGDKSRLNFLNLVVSIPFERWPFNKYCYLSCYCMGLSACWCSARASHHHWGAGLAEWWEFSHFTNVTLVSILDWMLYVGDVCCFSPVSSISNDMSFIIFLLLVSLIREPE